MHKPEINILIIAANFPPASGGGVMRATKMVRYLSDFGARPVVACRAISAASRHDPTLFATLPNDLKLYALPGPDPIVRTIEACAARLADDKNRRGPADRLIRLGTRMVYYVARAVRKLVVMPDSYIFWALANRRTVLDIARRERIDAIWATSKPSSSFVLARWVSKHTGCPWIADYRDLWTRGMSLNYPFWRRVIEKSWEQRLLGTASAVTVTTPSFARILEKTFTSLPRIDVIYNGFDPADYTSLDGELDPTVFTLFYAGVLYAERSPIPVLNAVKKLLDAGHVSRGEIKLRFAGKFDMAPEAPHRKFLGNQGLDDVVELMGQIPHAEAIDAMARAHMLLLLGETDPTAEAYIAGKLFEYMAVGRPILALQHPGENSRIVKSLDCGFVAPVSDVGAIADTLLTCFNRWKNGDWPEARSPSLDPIYNRRTQADQLATLCRSVLLPLSRTVEDQQLGQQDKS